MSSHQVFANLGALLIHKVWGNCLGCPRARLVQPTASSLCPGSRASAGESCAADTCSGQPAIPDFTGFMGKEQDLFVVWSVAGLTFATKRG